MNKKYVIDTEENKAFMKSLTEDLINFGRKFPAEDGASYYLGGDGTPMAERPRETWITCRMAHTYSLGKMLGFPGCEELVAKAVKGLTDTLQDKENGGWYPGVLADGTPMKDKQCYGHAFVILAASSASLIGVPGAKELLENALDVYDKHFWDFEKGLTIDTYNTDFSEADSYRGINANMHTVEAFLATADATGNEEYRKRAAGIVEHVLAWAKDNEWRIPEHFTSDWTPDLEFNEDKKDDPFKPYGATPGHGIEWARLTVQATNHIEEAELLYNRAISDGWHANGEDGIVYTTDWEGNPVVHDRMHWTLCEAINTSAVLYRLTGKQKYADDYAMFLQYADEKVIDHKNGSWLHQLDEKNNLKETVWPGKSDLYHAIQATLIPYADVHTSIATVLSNGPVHCPV